MTERSFPSPTLSVFTSGRIESSVCTGCGLCVQPCAPDAIVHADKVIQIKALQRH
jgi:Pyruvate/2-oxoacid:ferredoxin oxidoreductase delta subunit